MCIFTLAFFATGGHILDSRNFTEMNSATVTLEREVLMKRRERPEVHPDPVTPGIPENPQVWFSARSLHPHVPGRLRTPDGGKGCQLTVHFLLDFS